MKILLVEDSATLRHAMRSFILEAGHEPVMARSGEEALQLLENTPVDMIIMDVEMPGLNGFETTRLIREWLAGHWIPIIFVTGLNEDEDYREGIEAGGDDYLIKPVSFMVINAKIKAMERIADMRNQLSQLNAELEALSQLDSLTQIYNRRTFFEMAEQQWALAKRHEQPVSLLMIDVDHFKLFNDHYGHPAGDGCLKAIAQTIKTCLHRAADIFGRYGGEEFIVLLPETDIQGAFNVAQAINRAVAALKIRHDISPTHNFVSMSIGGATCVRTTNHSLDELIKNADRALYKVKRSGRNRALIDEVVPHKTLLIADSNEETARHFGSMLQQHFNLLHCENEKESIDLTNELHPDMILLGEDLASANDYHLCEILKSNPRTNVIPIAIMANDNTPPKHNPWGINIHLDRSLNTPSLLNKILQLLE